MSMTSVILYADKNLVMSSGTIMPAGEHPGIHIPERPSANDPGGREPAQWLLVRGDADHIDVTALVECGQVALLL